MKKFKKIPNTPKYGFGGMNSDTKKNVKDFAGNYGKFLLDNSANLIGIDAVGAGKGMDYSGKSADKFNKVSNVTGAVSKSLAPIAANIIAPGSGQFVSMGQQVAGGAYGKFGPQNEQGFNAYDNEGNPIVNQNDRSAQFGQMAGQIGGMAGMAFGKYGGQMKYAMGGMNKYPGGGTGEGNGQVELDENSVAPNGQFTQFNEPSHDVQNPNKPNASFDPGEKIFSAKLKIGNKTIADLNKANNTNREDKLLKDSTLGKTSALSLHLTKMAKMKNSDVLFAMQEQLKKDKVAAYAKKMGVEIPSMDNQQMNPQGMSGQPQGKMPMVRHGGMFAIGGVQLPYYNTDNAGNPIYAMGGGYPAMTNPYHNFRGNIPMYEDGGNMPIGATVPTGTTTPIPRTTTLPILPTSGSNNFVYENSPAYLAGKRANWGSTWGNVYGSNAGKNMTNQRLMSENKGLKYLSGDINKGTGLFEGPNPNDPTKTMKYFYAKTPENSYGLYPGDIMQETPKVIQDTIPTNTNISIPKKDWSTVQILRDGTHVRKFADGTTQVINLGDLEKKKYGGQMPMFKRGGKKGTSIPNSLKFIPQMADESEGEGVIVPGVPVSQYETDYTNALAPDRYNTFGKPLDAWDAARLNKSAWEADELNNPNAKKPITNPNDKPNWMKTLGNVGNFAAQNAPNIYNAFRYDKPEEEKYERAQAKYVDPAKAIANENYIYRQTKDAAPGLTGGNAGATLAALGANKAGTSSRIGRLRETYDNANAQIGNQINQYNTGLAQQEVIANAQNRARNRSGKGEWIGDAAKSFAQMQLDNKKGAMDEDMLEVYKEYYKNPEFRAAMKKLTFGSKK